MLTKITALTNLIETLADRPTMSAAELKQYFDSQPEQIRVAFNALIDSLGSSTTGDSGAHNIGSAVITGVTGATVYDQLASLKQLLDLTVTGQIPDGSVTPSKLSFDPATQAELDQTKRLISMGGMV